MASTIQFGKNIINILTSGMYKHPEFLFREYIQNAADQIDKDKGNADSDERILIYLDKTNREIRIEDKATGIPSSDVYRILGNVAASEKVAGTDKGMFGIGRLGGLSYCDSLVFETSYRGESVSTSMTWDAKTLLEKASSQDEHIDAATLISSVITLTKNEAPSDEHYFRVILKNVPERFSVLLDKERVLNYLRMTAPVKIDESKFSLYGKVREFLRRGNLNEPSTYRVFLNDEEIKKPYHTYADAPQQRTEKYKIRDIKTQIFKNDAGLIQGWAWVGFRDFSESASVIRQDCTFRGIRLRLHNIQIGGEDALTHLYHEDRAAKYFVGEIHVLDSTLTPNARRDYFAHTPEFDQFEKQVAVFLNSLFKEVREDSKIASMRKKIKQQGQIIRDYEDRRSRGFIDPEEKEDWENRKKDAETALAKEVQRYKKLTSEEDGYPRQESENRQASKSRETLDEQSESQTGLAKKGRIPLVTDKLNGYNRSEKKIITKILKVISKSLKNEPERYIEIEEAIINTLKKK